MSRSKLFSKGVSVLEVSSDKHVDADHNAMGMVLFQLLAAKCHAVHDFAEVLGDLVGDVVLELDERENALSCDFPHKVGRIP
jgi:hypothetical protein